MYKIITLTALLLGLKLSAQTGCELYYQGEKPEFNLIDTVIKLEYENGLTKNIDKIESNVKCFEEFIDSCKKNTKKSSYVCTDKEHNLYEVTKISVYKEEKTANIN